MIVIVKVAVVLIVILGGAAFVNAANWQPFIPAEHRHVRRVRMERHLSAAPA